MSNVVLSASIRANLLSLQGTTSLMDKTQLILSTGKKVNSALDNPTSFFTAKSLTDRASDLNTLLDAMGQSISGLKQADTGVTNLTKMVDQAKAIAGQARDALAKGTSEVKVTGNANLKNIADLTSVSGINTTSRLDFAVKDKNGTAVTLNPGSGQISISANDSVDQLVTKINDLNQGLNEKVIEAKLNDAGQLEIKAVNGASFSLNFIGNTGAVDDTAANLALAQALGFSGIADKVADGAESSNAQTYDIKITAKASASLDSIALYNGTSLAKASDTLMSLVTSSGGSTNVLDDGATGTDELIIGYNGTTTAIGFDANTSIQGLVDAVNNDAKLKGKIEMSFDGTTGKLNIRAVDASVQTVQFGIREDTNAETTSHADFGFGMAASLVANNAAAGAGTVENVESIRLASAAAELATFESEYNKIRAQIDGLVKDAGYRGTNLLNGDDLLTVFNEDRSTSITTKGQVLDSAGLGLTAANFSNAANVDASLTQVRGATDTLRTFASSLANDLAVIQTRQDFTKQTVNTLQEGSDKLTVADPNEEGAKMLALQTRQQLAVSALSLASQAQQSVLSLLR
jgi:flagellin-like hook-associated protein FlgL